MKGISMGAWITGAAPRIKQDEWDQDLLDERMTARENIDGPRIGDFLIFSDGVISRFSHDWEERGLQTSGEYEGSYHLGVGYASYSGGLNPMVPREHIRESDQTRLGRFWFFHHDFAQAHSAVYVELSCRVFLTDLPSNHWHAARAAIAEEVA